jgi:hypothetical protein
LEDHEIRIFTKKSRTLGERFRIHGTKSQHPKLFWRRYYLCVLGIHSRVRRHFNRGKLAIKLEPWYSNSRILTEIETRLPNLCSSYSADGKESRRVPCQVHILASKCGGASRSAVRGHKFRERPQAKIRTKDLNCPHLYPNSDRPANTTNWRPQIH